MNRLGLFPLFILSATASAAAPGTADLHAWYRADGLAADGPRVTAWRNAIDTRDGRNLSRIVGRPRPFLVGTAAGEQAVLRLDGKAALWQSASEWGTLASDRTLLALVRLAPGAEGFLFDGSTKSGQSRAFVRNGKWHVGSEAEPESTLDAKFGEWQVHTFVFEKNGGITHAVAGAEAKHLDTDEGHPLAGFILGADVATMNGLECDVAELLVFDRALDSEEGEAAVKDLQTRWGIPADLPEARQPQPAKRPDDPRIFRTTLRKRGDEGVNTYRIPGLATSAKGTLLAVFDIRHKNSGDLPADIDVGFMRSQDDGETWSPMKTLLDYDVNEPDSSGNGVGDPAILVDAKTGTLFVVALWSKGPRAWAGSGPGLTPEETGQLVLTKSTDDGRTWSKPESITPQVKDPAWRLCFNGPGSGIQLRDGSLVFAAQYKGADNVPHSCFIASTDQGATWKISPAAIPGGPPTSEAQIAELSDGALLLSMRDESRSGKRAWARWEWNGSLLQGRWSKPWSDVTDPTCMASLLRHPKGILLFSNPDHPSRRNNLTLRASHDDGRTWSAGRLLDPESSMYSCMTVLRDGRIGILYESGDTTDLVFVRFPLDWVLEQ